MNPERPEEADEFARAVRKAFAAAGGADLARTAEEDPTARAAIAEVLAALGVADLDPWADGASLAAAAALCEEAGRVALPYPVASVLLAAADEPPFAVVPDGIARVDHADLFPQWRVAGLEGPARRAVGGGSRLSGRLGPFVGDLELGDDDPSDPSSDRNLHLALAAFGILGTADRAVELAVEHTTTRVQFGKPISTFQSVQFALADAAVAVAGLRELAHFTLWRVELDPAGARTDVLALRLQAIDVARAVLRTSQQLHGAAGVCDEYDISLLARLVQPALRLPWSAERTAAELATAIQQSGFHGLFEHGHPA